MKCMKTRVIIITVILTLCAGPTIGADVKATGQPDKNLIQMAILLDTSNSMDGLIEQAKTQLWKIVNELALAKRNGETPNLEVALYEYGKDSLPAGEGYMRMIVPLTTDLDRVSEELFKLKTNGGSEYCGQVIQMAARGLKWTLDDLESHLYRGKRSFYSRQGGL